MLEDPATAELDITQFLTALIIMPAGEGLPRCKTDT